VNEEAMKKLCEEAEARSMKWSHDVKVKDGFVCTGCGELDKELLESQHTKPREVFPELAYDLDNGECLCIPCHAEKHKDSLTLYYKILARGFDILYKRTRGGV